MLSWWRNPCIKQIYFLSTLLQSAGSQRADDVAATSVLAARLRKGLSTKSLSCLQLRAHAVVSPSPWAKRIFFRKGIHVGHLAVSLKCPLLRCIQALFGLIAWMLWLALLAAGSFQVYLVIQSKLEAWGVEFISYCSN